MRRRTDAPPSPLQRLTLIHQDVKINLPAGMPPSDAGEVQSEGVYWVRVDRVKPMPGQPRIYFDEIEMEEFTSGIAAEGQHTPAWIKRIHGDPRYDYQLISGERRWRSLKKLGVSHIMAIFREPLDRFKEYRLAVKANYGGSDHQPLEITKQILELQKDPEIACLSQSQQLTVIAGIFCKSVGWVTNYYSLTKLPAEIREMMEPGPEEQRLKVTMGAFLSTITKHSEQLLIARHVVDKGLTVRQAREFARVRAAKQGFAVGSRPRRPSDDFKQTKGILERMQTDIGILQGIPKGRFEEMLLSRSPAERTALIKELGKNIQGLMGIVDSVGNLMREQEVSLTETLDELGAIATSSKG